MKLETVEIEGVTYAILDGGKPVYEVKDGKPFIADVPGMYSTISRVNAENKEIREAKTVAETKLKAFDGIDASTAEKALQIVKNLDDKKLVDAGEVQKVKDETKKAFKGQLAGLEDKLVAAQKDNDTLRSNYDTEKITSAFAGSKFVKDKLAIPADMVQATFGNRFKIENGRIVPKDAAGNQIFSLVTPGEIAPFDEAMERLIDAHPHRDMILKGSGQTGSGADALDGGNDGKRTMKRQQFEGLDPSEQHKYAQAMQKGELRLVD